MEEKLIELAGNVLKELFAFPVWWFVIFINITALMFHFSVLASFKVVQKYRAAAVLFMATICAAGLGIRDFLSHDFTFSEEDIIYQARLISSWAASVVIYHLGGLRKGVKMIKKRRENNNAPKS